MRKVVIAGMGYIALEMCEAFSARGIAVTMVKPGPAFLPWMANDLSHMLREEIELRGVEMITGASVERIEKTGSGLQVMGAVGPALDCDLVLTAIGVRPNSELAKEAGLALGPHESISVDQSMRTSDENIYAAGDCADAYHVVTGGKVWIPLALRANRAGWAAADNVLGKDVRLSGVAGTGVFKIFDMEAARTGLNAAEAEAYGFDPAETVIRANSRAHAHPGSKPIGVSLVGDRRSGRLLGAQMVGAEGAAHRINAAAVALHAQMTVENFAQSDLSYAPPFGPTWDPLLVAANQLLKQL